MIDLVAEWMTGRSDRRARRSPFCKHDDRPAHRRAVNGSYMEFRSNTTAPPDGAVVGHRWMSIDAVQDASGQVIAAPDKPITAPMPVAVALLRYAASSDRQST